MYNSFLDYAYSTDVKIEFDEPVFFEVINPNTGAVSYLKIQAVIGQETNDIPGEGNIILKEERLTGGNKKNGLWAEEIDLSFGDIDFGKGPLEDFGFKL